MPTQSMKAKVSCERQMFLEDVLGQGVFGVNKVLDTLGFLLFGNLNLEVLEFQ